LFWFVISRHVDGPFVYPPGDCAKNLELTGTVTIMKLRRTIGAAAFRFAFIICISLPVSPVLAADDGPGAFVTRLGEKTIAKLTDASLSPAVREDQFRDLLREGFAVKTIGQFVLGKYRRTTSQETIDAFVRVFEEYVVSLYAKQFKHYSGQKFLVEKVADTSRKGDSMVMTKIFPRGNSQPLRVNFQVRNFGDTFKILDVRVEGVSMVLAQRDEFTSYISTNGGKVEALIDALRKRMAISAASAEK
jgi:phospholipid transport system substrate-binding protein